jgi:hypothetical protein
MYKIYFRVHHHDIDPVFKHPVALQCLHTNFVNNAIVFFYYLMTLNTICFGHRWPSSGVPLCQICYTALNIVHSMCMFEHFVIKMFPLHSMVVRYVVDVTIHSFKIVNILII